MLHGISFLESLIKIHIIIYEWVTEYWQSEIGKEMAIITLQQTISKIECPTDIKGPLTFLYYSYSFDDSETIGLITYGNKDIETITHKTVHTRTKYIRFIIGGNDNDRYLGFNDQFT